MKPSINILFSFLMLSFFVNLSAQDQGDRWWHYEYFVFTNNNSEVFNLFEVEDTLYAAGMEGFGNEGARFAMYKIDQKGTLVDVDTLGALSLSQDAIVYNSQRKEFLFVGDYLPKDAERGQYHISAIDLQGDLTFSNVVDLSFDTDMPSYTVPLGMYPYENGYVIYGYVDRDLPFREDNYEGMLIFLDRNYRVVSKYMLEDLAWGPICHVYSDREGQLKAIFGKELDRLSPIAQLNFYTVDIDPTYFWKDSSLLMSSIVLGVNSGRAQRGVIDMVVNPSSDTYYPMTLAPKSGSIYDFAITALDQKGEERWRLESQSLKDYWLDSIGELINVIGITNHFECQNKDIIYMGYITISKLSSRNVFYPFAIRFAPDGTIKWRRAFDKLNDNGHPFGLEYQWGLEDVVEDKENGDLTFWGWRQTLYDRLRFTPMIIKVDSNGCMGDEIACGEVQPILVSSEDIISSGSQTSKIYPNPSSNHVIIEHDYMGEVEVCLLDVTGSLLESQKFTNKKISIDVSTYARGIYFINMYKINGTLLSSQKIVLH